MERPVQRPQTTPALRKYKKNAVIGRMREGGRSWVRNDMITGYGST